MRTPGGMDLDAMTPEDLQAQLVARERDMKYHLQALKGELTEVIEDVNVAGRPLSDRIRERPLEALGLSAGVGAVLGIALGLVARSRRRVPPDDGLDFTRARLAMLIDEAAYRVASGMSSEQALRVTAKTVPAVYMDRDPRLPVPQSPTQQALGLAWKSALGFATKTGLDLVTKKLNGALAAAGAVVAAVALGARVPTVVVSVVTGVGAASGMTLLAALSPSEWVLGLALIPLTALSMVHFARGVLGRLPGWRGWAAMTALLLLGAALLFSQTPRPLTRGALDLPAAAPAQTIQPGASRPVRG